MSKPLDARSAPPLLGSLLPVILGLLFGLTCSFTAGSVRAQQVEASETDNEARALFGRGSAAYERGDYAAAKRYFEAAYNLSGRPQLLYNVAVAADHLRQDEDALRAYRAYLAALPEARNGAEVRARIAVLAGAQAQKQPAPAVATPKQAAQSVVDSEATAPEPDRRADHKPLFKRWWLWTAVAAVAAGAGIGIALATRERGTESALPGDNGLVVQTLVAQ